jgi:hypothetical protein
MMDMFPYELIGTQNWQRSLWVKEQMEIEEKIRKRENIKIKAINLFRGKNNKLKLKEVDPF